MLRISQRKILLVISIVLFIIPFFWLSPGEMDLGGDSSRLYFYDPIHYLQYNLLYVIIPTGFGIEQPLSLFLPFGMLLVITKYILRSSYLIITLFNSFNLVVAFLSIYSILRETLQYKNVQKESLTLLLASIFGALYYIFSPIMVRTAWDKAIITHAQFFLNPLIFYLLLKFFKNNKLYYLYITLLITFIFSVNFSWAAAPLLLSFYPFAVLYLVLFTRIILRKRIPIKQVGIFLILFLIIHSFHIIPMIIQILDRSGTAFSRTFTTQGQMDIGLAYFLGIAPNIKLTPNLLGLPQLVPSIIPYEVLLFITPILFVLGCILNARENIEKQQKVNFLLLFVFFLILIFLMTANITHIGFAFYTLLFRIPGFSMFRNFYGQWVFAYLFFMTLLLGNSLLYVLLSIKRNYLKIIVFTALSGLIIMSAVPFIKGDMINLILNKGEKREFKIPIKMDPEYEKVLSVIRGDKNDSKYLTLPFTESFIQMLRGTNKGVYQGPSTIALLTGKSDFPGYQTMSPFSEVFLKIAKSGDYRLLNKMLGMLNIKYIFYNSDPSITAYFPNFPYQHIKDFLPQNQNEYLKFIEGLGAKKINDFGYYYHIYKLPDEYYLPHIYGASSIVSFNNKLDQWGYFQEPFFSIKDGIRSAYVPRNMNFSKKLIIPKITFQKINPSKYSITIENASGPYFLVFSEAFNNGWKLYLKNNVSSTSHQQVAYFQDAIVEKESKSIFINNSTFETINIPYLNLPHVLTNGYANGWYIKPESIGEKLKYTLILEMEAQRYLYLSILISIIGIIILLICLTATLIRRI